jgi:hypothetical protein
MRKTYRHPNVFRKKQNKTTETKHKNPEKIFFGL